LAFSLAAQRFADQPLILEGSDEFKSAIVELSTLPGFDVTFADAGLELARKNRAQSLVAPERPGLSGAAAYVAEQNRKGGLQRVAIRYRVWKVQDSGGFTFEGCRTFSDGTSGVLLARASEIVVKQIGEQELLRLSGFPSGCLVTLGSDGLVVERERRAHGQPARLGKRPEGPEHEPGR